MQEGLPDGDAQQAPGNAVDIDLGSIFIGVIAKATMAIILQYIHVFHQQAVHLEITQCYMSNIFQLKKPF